MRILSIFPFHFALLALAVSQSLQALPVNKATLVNTLIGTSNGGNTFPGAVLPWGMAHIAPHNTQSTGWSGSQYYFGNTYLYGFGQTHLSGVGCGDFSNITLTPTAGPLFTDSYKNRSRYANEVTQAGYYKVDLTSHKLTAELTATLRSTLSRYTFAGTQANLILNVTDGLSPSKEAYVKINSPYECEGWNHTGGFCQEGNKYTIYFVAQFSQPAVSSGMWKNRDQYPGMTKLGTTNGDMGAWFTFGEMPAGGQILVKVGLSYVSIENARLNLQTEQPGWDFEKVKADAQNEWNKQLSRIEVSGGTTDEQTSFYTALYHALIHPNIIDDVNGQYPAMKSHKTKTVKNRHQYTVFSLWDTYRTLHPLLTLVYPEVQIDILHTMTDHVLEGGELPFWELAADETYVMNGDPAAIVVADSYVKGLTRFDLATAYKAMKHSALDTVNNRIRPMQKYYTRYNFIPYDDCGPDDRWGKRRMVSECLEYAYADFATAQIARALNDTATASYLMQRSNAFTYYFDPSTGLLRPRNKDLSWFEPFYPSSYKGSWSNPGFVEGNSWQYSFFVPHNIPGLMQQMGGPKTFADKLTQCFTDKNFTVDNEPDLAYPYLFNYVPGQENRTRELIAHLMEHEFLNAHNGLPGNDDAGTISAWYVFSALGFYPDCPGKPEYQLGIPLFNEARIKLNPAFYKGSEISIQRKQNRKPADYQVLINGVKASQSSLSHQTLTNGCKLVFE